MADTSGLAFIHNGLDRAHPRREDAAFLAGLAERGDARFVIIAGDRPVFSQAGNPHGSALFDRGAAERLARGGEEIFLGFTADEAPVFARLAPQPAGDEPRSGGGNGAGESGFGDGLGQADLRALALQGLVPDEEVSVLAMARSMLAWHESHRFCSKCGARSAMAIGGFRRDCAACGAQHFPRTDPVVIMLISHGEHALIARSARFVPGMYSALAGFVEPGETIEQAARREIFEEAGIRVGRVSYFASQPWPYPSSLMIGLFGEAETTDIAIDPKEIEDARWVSRAEIGAALAGHGDFKTPQPVAIAYHLLRSYAENGA